MAKTKSVLVRLNPYHTKLLQLLMKKTGFSQTNVLRLALTFYAENQGVTKLPDGKDVD